MNKANRIDEQKRRGKAAKKKLATILAKIQAVIDEFDTDERDSTKDA